MDVIAAANMLVIDENLRDRTPSHRPFRHFVPSGLIAIDGVFGVGDLFTVKKGFGLNAIRTAPPRVNFDQGLGHAYEYSTKMPKPSVPVVPAVLYA
jgi:hypothetical protein